MAIEKQIGENKIKDWSILFMVGGLLALLTIITIGDFYVALHENRPVDESVVNLLQMSITGMVGIIAGYISGNPKQRKCPSCGKEEK